MYISAMLTSLPLDFEEAIRTALALGFRYVDLVALQDRPAAHLESLAEAGLIVSCASIGRHLPEGHTLDAVDFAIRRQTVEAMKEQIADAARLGATCCYVVPGMDGSDKGLLRFADSCSVLADYASSRMMTFCVEHFPGRALATAGGMLQWIEQNRLDNVKLLLDVGHCLISEEDPSRCIVEAGDRLGYVHFDDNDSAQDLHWPLLTGKLSRDMVEAVMTVLRMSHYQGGLALELNPKNDDPVGALRDGKRILEEEMG